MQEKNPSQLQWACIYEVVFIFIKDFCCFCKDTKNIVFCSRNNFFEKKFGRIILVKIISENQALFFTKQQRDMCDVICIFERTFNWFDTSIL